MGHINVLSKGVILDSEEEMIVIRFTNDEARKQMIAILQSMEDGRLYYIEAPGELSKEEYDELFTDLVPDYEEPNNGSKEIYTKQNG